MSERLLAGIEAGGTKFRVAVGRPPHSISAETTITTTTPEETIGAAVDFLRTVGALAGAGIASFGPLDLDPDSPAYGSITATPKPGWSNVDLLGTVARALQIPVAIDVDVGGAVLAESRWGEGRGVRDLVYITLGTGIGGGLMVDGRIHHGHGHPEMGHVPVAPEPDDAFEGACPFHGACLEGMAAGPAIAARWGSPADELADRAEVWDLEARYLAQGIRAITYVVAPSRIILGGGISQVPGLLDRIRIHLAAALNGYPASALPETDPGYVRLAGLGQDAGLVGALTLAGMALEKGG